MRDDDVRSSCFAALEVLCAKHGIEVPYAGGLDQGFAFRGRRVPFVTVDDPPARSVTLTPGRMVGPYDEREPILARDPIERRYAVRETRVRLHQARFRARVLPAYANQCTICRLKETRLLDAAQRTRKRSPFLAATGSGPTASVSQCGSSGSGPPERRRRLLPAACSASRRS